MWFFWFDSGNYLYEIPSIAIFNAAMYEGVVPQQPPTILTRPSFANYLTLWANPSGVSS